MCIEKNANDSAQEFARYIEEIQKKTGTELLSDDDLLVLAAEQISRTFTYEERGYK
jgi:hypothetical protein